MSDKVYYEFAHVHGNGTKRHINSADNRRSFSLPVNVLEATSAASAASRKSRACALTSAFLAGADFEVAIGSDGKVQIVQVRPITTGKLHPESPKKMINESIGRNIRELRVSA